MGIFAPQSTCVEESMVEDKPCEDLCPRAMRMTKDCEKKADGAKTGNPHAEIICKKATDLSGCAECSDESGCVEIVGYQQACTRESQPRLGCENDRQTEILNYLFSHPTNLAKTITSR